MAGGNGVAAGRGGACGCGCACIWKLGGTGFADLFAGSEVAAGDAVGADEGLSKGFGTLMPVTLKVMLVVPLLVVVVLMCSPFGPMLSSILVVSVGGGGCRCGVWAGSGRPLPVGVGED